VSGGLFKSFCVRDGRLITGQQQYSGRKVAQAVIAAVGRLRQASAKVDT
jgi:putative intracellular protease/amidase